MIMTLTGKNSYALRRRLDELMGEFVEKYGDLALEKFDGEEYEAKTMIEGLHSLPFLAPKKLVVVRNGSLNK
jgi:DNA polymerase III delta subunit